MKRIFTLLAAVILTASIFLPKAGAQVPQGLSYQAVIRNSIGKLVANTSVGMRISILQGDVNGTLVYEEIYNPNPQTNSNGLLTVEIGVGISVSGAFTAINWAEGPYFLKTETDPTGGTNYTITGVSQLLSVPYALYAKTAENGFSGNYADLTNKPDLSDTVNYLKIETEPAFNSSIAKGIKKSDTANWDAKSNFSGNYADLKNKPNLSDTSKYLKTETEPAFNASLAKGIK